MTTEQRIELAVRRTRDRLMAEYPQPMDVLHMLEYLAQELAKLGRDDRR